MRIVLLGPPGAGKGTMAQVLCQELSIVHVSTGDMLRQSIKAKAPLGLKAKAFMEQGKLVPDDVVIALVAERLSEADAKKGFLLDGFPRTPEQAKSLDESLQELKMPLDLVAYFKTSQKVVLRRLAGRRVCAKCGRNFHLKNFKPKKEGVCDDCGSDLVQRPDDKEETVLNRLKVYEEQTEPLTDYYKKKGMLSEVSGDLEVHELKHKLMDLFEKKGL